MPTREVRINGTDKNPFERLGLKHNPFPQLGHVEWNKAEMQLNSLGGEPVKGPDDIRERLAGFAPEFVEGVVKRYRPGEMVVFTFSFPE